MKNADKIKELLTEFPKAEIIHNKVTKETEIMSYDERLARISRNEFGSMIAAGTLKNKEIGSFRDKYCFVY
jgi:hypothetical protein